jgi:hypothetical protein
MDKLKNIGIYSKHTGEELDFDIIEEIQDEERKKKYAKLFWKYENKRDEMSLEEVEDLRKVLLKGRYKKDVYLKYKDGFYMVAKNTEDNLKKLSFETNGFLHLLGFHINKSGVIIYKNKKPIKSFEKLRVFIGMSDRVWRRVKKEVDEFGIVRKENLRDGVILILNPEYSGSSYEVTEYRFLVFGDYYKSKLTPIDYLYLVKRFEIDTSAS